MELLAQILCHAVENGNVSVTFPDVSIERLFESACFRALSEIKAVVDDDTLDDADCFERIEKIIGVFEKYGSDCGGRHDF